MSEVPTAHVDQFLSPGVDSLTIHVEAGGDIAAILQHIRMNGCRCGVALSPETPIDAVERFLPQIQMVLLMTVVPGSVGHPQSDRCVEKAGALVRLPLRVRASHRRLRCLGNLCRIVLVL